MKITICGSMVFSEKMLEVKKELENKEHDVLVSSYAEAYAGKNEKEKETLTIHDKETKDAMKEHYYKIRESDAILVLNYTRKNIDNYIGGNTLMEIGLAYFLNKKIFLLNPVPDIEFYKSEIEAVKPTILNGDLSKITG